MRKYRKETPKRPRKPTAGEVAVIIADLGTLLTDLAALLNALK